jgi:hypothetical protein
MAKLAKFLQGVAGVGGAGLNVEEVFSTYLYDGNNSTQTITNGIDLAGEGGLVWAKQRTGTSSQHALFDTENGTLKALASSNTSALATEASVTSFNSNGFSLGNFNNTSGQDYVSWTFRKAPKFFDVVTFSTTTGSSTPITVNHNLGSVPGMIIVKTTSIAGDWFVFHRSLGSTKYLDLGSTDQAQTGGTSKWASAPTSTSFTLGGDFVQNATYVAYLFAHNNGDGEFGPSADQDIIKCGSFTTDGSGNATVNLGWEPQFVLWKITNYSADWNIYDSMRGFVVHTSGGKILRPNTANAELNINQLRPSATGFDGVGVGGGGAAYNVIYMAIRRGPMAVPESATDVFAIDQQNSSEPYLTSGFPVDFAFQKRKDTSSNWMTGSRLQGQRQLNLDLTAAEGSETAHEWDYMNGFRSSGYSTDWFGWMWKRAPNYFDVVAYTGNGTAGRTVSHNLGVAPEMIWVKSRSNTENWQVGHKDLTGTWNRILYLNSTAAESSSNAVWWNNTAPTNEVFSVGTQDMNNGSGLTYIAYLFASLDGVSKVGSVTIQSGSTTVDCGFSGGPRFVLLKRTDGTSSWNLFDSERGIVAGNDPYLNLNQNAAQITGNDLIDPTSSGFTLTNLWTAGQTWLYYAIA